jgi:hypothetical protein
MRVYELMGISSPSLAHVLGDLVKIDNHDERFLGLMTGSWLFPCKTSVAIEIIPRKLCAGVRAYTLAGELRQTVPPVRFL